MRAVLLRVALRRPARAPVVAEQRVAPQRGAGTVCWPSERYRDEYAAESPHLTEPYELPGGPLVAGAAPEVDRLARRRVLLDLPSAW